jgi:hypothetical protein
MRKTNEVLRLRFELGLGQRAIARACSISQGAVHNYLKKAAAAGIHWPLPEGWDEPRIEEALFGDRRPVEQRPRDLPDFPALREQLQRCPHLTLQLAWEEYRQVHPDGYGYSRFCELYGRWRKKQDVVLRQEHQPGEKGFVDWAGATIPVQDPVSGEIWPAALFVMVLGASSYTYVQATRDQQLTAWLSSHMHAFEYFGGVPRLLVPDQSAYRSEPRVPLRSGSQPHVPRVRDALRRGRGAGTSLSSERQGQGRSGCADRGTLDHRGLAASEVLPVGRSKPCDSGTARTVEPAAVPEAPRIACQCVCVA